MGHGVEEARGQAAQATVAEAGVDLLAAEGVEVGAHLLDALRDEVADAEVDQIVVKQGTEEELEGEVVDLLGSLGVGLREDGATLVGDELGEGVEALVVGKALEGRAVARDARLAVLLDKVLLVLKNLVVSQSLS